MLAVGHHADPDTPKFRAGEVGPRYTVCRTPDTNIHTLFNTVVLFIVFAL